MKWWYLGGHEYHKLGPRAHLTIVQAGPRVWTPPKMAVAVHRSSASTGRCTPNPVKCTCWHTGPAPEGWAHWMPGLKVLETSSRLCVKASCAIAGNAQLVLVSSFHRESQCLLQVFLFIIIPFTFMIRDRCHLMFPHFSSVEQKLSKIPLSYFWICFTQEEIAQQLQAGL